MRTAGWRSALDSRCCPWIYELPGGCSNCRACRRVGDWIHPFALGVSSSAESLPACRRMPDGHIFGHRRCGAADCAHRRGIRSRSNSSGNHFPGKPGVGLLDSSCWNEPLSCLVSILQALVRSVALDYSNSSGAPRRCIIHYLCSVADNRVAKGPRTVAQSRPSSLSPTAFGEIRTRFL